MARFSLGSLPNQGSGSGQAADLERGFGVVDRDAVVDLLAAQLRLVIDEEFDSRLARTRARPLRFDTAPLGATIGRFATDLRVPGIHNRSPTGRSVTSRMRLARTMASTSTP